MTSARRRRRGPGPGCRGRASACAPPVSRAQARWLYARRLTWRRLAPSALLDAPLGTPRFNARGAILRPLTAQATVGLGKVRFGSECPPP